MTYGRYPYGGVAFAGSDVDEIPQADVKPGLAVEVAFTTDALETPVWVDITTDVRSWNTTRGRNRELERYQPGRATVVLGNLSRQYDSQHATGPWFGNLRPMRRIRIRETFNGVTYPTFDGFVDSWELDYPLTGKDATATITATDAFKVFARTDLPSSVYRTTVDDDAPQIWWRLDENLAGLQSGSVLNVGSLGTTHNGTFKANPRVGSQGLIVNDPSSAMSTVNSDVNTGTPVQGFELAAATFDLLAQSEWTVEMWVREADNGTAQGTAWCYTAAADTVYNRAICGRATDGTFTNQFIFAVFNDAGTLYYGRQTAVNFVVPHSRYHVVCTKASSGLLRLFVNGVEQTTAISGGSGTTHPGPLPSGKPLTVGFTHRTNDTETTLNWHGDIDEVAIYTSVLSDARILDHYTAGTAPWSGDLPGTRAGRILDELEWPAAWRSLENGAATLQSATLNTTALEHLQKVAESEFGLLFIDRTGNVRFVSRATVATRTLQGTFGDSGTEVRYRGIVFDDGDAVIRNRATISRLNGVAQNSEAPASVTEFGRFDYKLDGLLHSSDTHSQDYADYIVDEYNQPRRRVTSLVLGPAAPGAESSLYPQTLGRELGEAIDVLHRPPGGGSAFTQRCVIEGISHGGVPGGGMRGIRTTTWILSPELTVAVF